MRRNSNEVDKRRRTPSDIPAVHHFEQEEKDFLNCGQTKPNTCATPEATLERPSEVIDTYASNMNTTSSTTILSQHSDEPILRVSHVAKRSTSATDTSQKERESYRADAHRQPVRGKTLIHGCVICSEIREVAVLAFGDHGVGRRGQASWMGPIGKTPRSRKATGLPSRSRPTANRGRSGSKHNSTVIYKLAEPQTSSTNSDTLSEGGLSGRILSTSPVHDHSSAHATGNVVQAESKHSSAVEDRQGRAIAPSTDASTLYAVDAPSDSSQSYAKTARVGEADPNAVPDPSVIADLQWKIEAMRNVIAPVTKENIKELELTAIQNTLSLRIDLCFDHDLYFQRISGRKGEEKRVKAEIFYKCLSSELKSIMHSLNGSVSECEHRDHSVQFYLPSRLAAFFSSLRDLLELLVPDAEKDEVVQRVDADWLTTQVRVGKFEAVPFATWLCDLLMRHCAPMRDEMAQKMRQKIVDGAEQNDMDTLVEGLEILLNLLENMKIDVANHQVRSFKLLLIADTVPFLRDCFKKMIRSHQLDLQGSRTWFEETQDLYQLQSVDDFTCFIHGLVRLICVDEDLQTTFSYDKERIEVLRTDFLDMIQLEICEATYRDLASRKPRKVLTRREQRNISSRILDLISSEDGTCDRVENHVDTIAIEVARAVADVSLNPDSPSSTSLPCESDIEYATSQLNSNLDKDKKMHGDVMRRMAEQVTERTIFNAKCFLKLDTLQVSNSQRTWSMDRLAKGFLIPPDVEDISRRLAHIAIIHWQVWYGLVYSESSQSLAQSLSESDSGVESPSVDLFT